MHLSQWAHKWGIPAAAILELKQQIGIRKTDPETSAPPQSEAAVQADIRHEASTKGMRLWRNNVGVAFTREGVPVRYGLCNDSRRLNDHIKSSDLVGIKPIVVTPAHVGQTIGQFMCREVKHRDWKYSGSSHEVAQKSFIELVLSFGGDAGFVSKVGTL